MSTNNLTRIDDDARDNQSASAAPMEALMSTVATATKQNAEILGSVGAAAGQFVNEAGEQLKEVCDTAMAELRDEVSHETDRELIKAELKEAVADVINEQHAMPAHAVGALRQTHARVKQLNQRAVDATIGAAMLDAVKAVADKITPQDVADARECAEKLDALETLFGDKPIFEDTARDAASDLSKLSEREQKKIARKVLFPSDK